MRIMYNAPAGARWIAVEVNRYWRYHLYRRSRLLPFLWFYVDGRDSISSLKALMVHTFFLFDEKGEEITRP